MSCDAPLNTDVIIPARLNSARLPGKLLMMQTGKTLLQHTYEAAASASLVRSVYVAASDREIIANVKGFGGRALVTHGEFTSGTDRVAAATQQLSNVDFIINLQGDEPETTGDQIDLVVSGLRDTGADLCTLATPVCSQSRLDDPNRVKVVVDHAMRAMYFSRAPIPYLRDWSSDRSDHETPFLEHVGVYGYRIGVLCELSRRPPSTYEKVERLEQLRALQAGYSIHVAIIEGHAGGIDTQAEYDTFVQRQMAAQHESSASTRQNITHVRKPNS